MSKKQEKAMKAFQERMDAFAEDIAVCDSAWLCAVMEAADLRADTTDDCGIARVLAQLSNAAADVDAHCSAREWDEQQYGGGEDEE